MGVLYDIYCIPARPFAVDWSTLLDRMISDGLVLPALWAGHPLRTIASYSMIRTPDLAPLEAMVGEPDAPRAFERVEEALAHVARDDAAMVVVEVPASSVRREPQKFHPMSSYLGLYRFREGHDLVVGRSADPSFEADDSKARWRGKVVEFLWIHGKNAPLREDFEGSSLHVAMSELWPDCLVHGDERL